jgi:prephenate dehydrogenase
LNTIKLHDLSVTIVGLGLIGGSLAKSIRKNLKIKNLWAVDIDSDILSSAANSGVIDKGFTKPQFPLENSDIVILCIYPRATVNFLKENMKYFKNNAIITDTAGVKNKIVAQAECFVRNDLQFIGGHPMSGRESIGYNFSSHHIFEGAQYILTPTAKTSQNSLILLKGLILGMGFKEVVMMTPEKHDETVAFTSQLPHIIAITLMNSDKLDGKLDGIGGSFRDLTRIADINNGLWSELIYENKDNILKELERFLTSTNDIYHAIKNEESDYLHSIFQKSSLRRKEMKI